MAAPTHYSGEYDLGTGTLHHHSTAKALFAGPCTTFLLHRLMHRFVRFDSGGIISVCAGPTHCVRC